MSPLLVAFALVLQGPTAPIAQENPIGAQVRERIAERTQPIVDAIHANGVPGVSAAIVLPEDAGEIPLTAGYSWKEEEKELLPGDRLLSGSVGKTYVTAAVHHLVQAEKLTLDDYAVDYFEDADWIDRVPNAGEITVHQLLRHQTGIPRYVFKPGFWEALLAEPDKVWKPEELLAYVFDDAPLFAPGEGWAYADTNYIVLGMIVEHVSGGTYYDYVQANLLTPHGLQDTVPSTSRKIPGLVQGYVVVSKQFGVPDRVLEDGKFVFNPQFEWCGGGYANTPLDLARWAKILYSGRAFDGPYLETMLEAVPARQLGPGRSYGLGVIVTETELGPMYGHDGFMPGYNTTIGYFPEHDLAVAIQCNSDDSRAVGKPLPLVLVELATIAVEELGG